MEILFLCGSYKLSIFECILNDVASLLSLFLAFLIIFQIYIRIWIYKIPLHNSTSLFYLMFIQTTVYNYYNMITPYPELYLIEIYLRHILFVYVTYFFSKKAWKFETDSRRSRLWMMKIFTVLLVFYFTGVLFYSLFKVRTLPLCKDSFWVYLRVSGILICFLACFVAYGLGKLLQKTLGEYKNRHELEKSVDEKSLVNIEYKAMGSMIYENLKRNVDNLWRIVLFLTLSQFLSFCNYLYYLFNDNPSCDLLVPDTRHPKCLKIDILNLIIMMITKIICYFAPLIVTTTGFWKPFKRTTTNQRDDEVLEDEVPEGYYGNLGYNYGVKVGLN